MTRDKRIEAWLVLLGIVMLAAMFVTAINMEAQTSPQRDSQTAATGVTLTFDNPRADTVVNFEYLLTGSPTSSSIVLSGCMIGGTCDAIETYTGNANSTHNYSGPKVYDYFTIVPTLNGGSSPKLKVNRLSVRAAVSSSSTASGAVGQDPFASTKTTEYNLIGCTVSAGSVIPDISGHNNNATASTPNPPTCSAGGMTFTNAASALILPAAAGAATTQVFATYFPPVTSSTVNTANSAIFAMYPWNSNYTYWANNGNTFRIYTSSMPTEANEPWAGFHVWTVVDDATTASKVYKDGVPVPSYLVGPGTITDKKWAKTTTATASLTGNVATYNQGSAHSYAIGQLVNITGCTNPVYNQTDAVVASSATPAFTVAITNADIGSAAETCVVKAARYQLGNGNGVYAGTLMYYASIPGAKPTDQQVLQNYQYIMGLMRNAGITVDKPKMKRAVQNQIEFVGTSITYGYLGTDPTTLVSLDATWNTPLITNNGVNSMWCKDIRSGFDWRDVPVFSEAAYRNVLFIDCATNDLVSETEQQVMGYVAEMARKAHNLGATVVASTVIDRTGLTARKNAYNNLLLTEYKTANIDYVCDPSASALIGKDGQNTNATYFNVDNIHPKAAGSTELASIWSKCLNSLGGNRTWQTASAVTGTYAELAKDAYLIGTTTAAVTVTGISAVGFSPNDVRCIWANGANNITYNLSGSETWDGTGTSKTITAGTRICRVAVRAPGATGGANWQTYDSK